MSWDNKREKQKRIAARKLVRYSVFRSGQRLSEFAYPKEQAERIFSDLLSANPLNELLPIVKPVKGDGMRAVSGTKFPSPRMVKTQ